jgi:hypothetical protein
MLERPKKIVSKIAFQTIKGIKKDIMAARNVNVRNVDKN